MGLTATHDEQCVYTALFVPHQRAASGAMSEDLAIGGVSCCITNADLATCIACFRPLHGRSINAQNSDDACALVA